MYKATAICFMLIPAIGVSAAQTTRQPKLYSVEVKRPNLVIHGANLLKVELWAVPTGTGVTPDVATMMVGRAKRSAKAGSKEVWLLSLEPCPEISATEVFVKAYDSRGKVVATKSLPYHGATDIYERLCGNYASPSS